jgi:hypothetical protein
VLVGHQDLPHSAADLALLYRAKDMVEKDFQVIKSAVELRPVRHHTDVKVRAHVTLCMLALLLERTLRDWLADQYTVEQALELLEPCRLNCYRTESGPSVYAITEIDRQQRPMLRRLRLLGGAGARGSIGGAGALPPRGSGGGADAVPRARNGNDRASG